MGFNVQDRREAPPVCWAELRVWRFFEVAGLPDLRACMIKTRFKNVVSEQCLVGCYTARLCTILLLKQDGFLLANLYQSVFLSSSVTFFKHSFFRKASISFAVGLILAIL
jgi:hypothetical protein